VFDELTGLVAALRPDAAVFAVDGERNVVSWSPGATELFGLGPDEMLGAHCLKANRCATCMRGCGLSEHKAIDAVDLELFAADGRSVPVTKWGRAFFRSDGSFAGGIEVLVPRERLPRRKPPASADVATFHGLVTRDSR
jgi:hypothetical protein